VFPANWTQPRRIFQVLNAPFLLAVSRPGSGNGKPDPFLSEDGYQTGAVSFPMTGDPGFQILSVPDVVLGMG
jgi:hypothetical protein